MKRAPSPREQENRELQQTICTVWKQYRGIYSAPRIHAQLQEQGMRAGHNRIARLMCQAGIRGKTACKPRPTTQSDPPHPVVANVLDRQFTASRVNVGDIRQPDFIDAAEGFLYLVAVMDLYSRQIVGMAMAGHLRTELVESAQEYYALPLLVDVVKSGVK